MPLPVYYENRLVGYITENGAGLSFAYASEWWTASDTFAISLTMPLRGEPYPPDIATPWFANLLPENRLLEPAPFPDFIEPCLASLREKVPPAPATCTSSSSTATACRRTCAMGGGADALLTFPHVFAFFHRRRITELAAQHRLPAMYGWREYASRRPHGLWPERRVNDPPRG